MKAQRVTGVGGIFFKAKDNKKLGAWGKKHLGLDVGEEWTGCIFPWRDAKNRTRKAAPSGAYSRERVITSVRRTRR